jgi:voltage-gated potassium channel Kch
VKTGAPAITWRRRLRYAFDNTMSRGTPALVGWLAVATAVMIALFSAVVLLFGLAPERDDGTKPGAVRQVFDSLLHALDPGTVAGDPGGWKFLLTMLVLTLAGLFIVSALIGVIATGLDTKLQELRKGRSFVVERDHTLILGWSDTVFTILAELAIANESEKDPVVVILAERDKVEMEDAIRDKVPKLGRTRVVCRSGSPIDLDDLEIVNPHAARSIVVVAEAGDPAPDANVIKVVLALTQGPRRKAEAYHIVAEISDPVNLEAARLVGGDEAVLIDKRETIARLIVQASRQSGVSVVYGDLLDFEGDEVYFRHEPRLVGRPFGEALLAYDDCAVIGLRRDGKATQINPPADTEIGPADEVIAIAADDARLASAEPCTAAIDDGAIVAAPPAGGSPETVLLLGWNARTIEVLRELDEFVRPGSRATVMAEWPAAEDQISAEAGTLGNLEVSLRAGNTTDRRTLDSLRVTDYDHVIVMSDSEVLDRQRADARTLITLLHLRDISARTGADYSIVSEMLDDRNRELAQVTQVDDVIVSDRLISLMIAQISENPHLEDVFSELFQAAGSEIYLRPAGEYVRPGVAISFATVVEAARRRGEVAVGYRQSDADGDATGGVVLNPRKSDAVELAGNDRVIVLAES